jgi:hypothetical protein
MGKKLRFAPFTLDSKTKADFKLKRSKSSEGISAKSSPSIFDNEKSSTTSTILTDDFDEKASDRLLRQASIKRLRRRLEQMQSRNDDTTNSTSPQGNAHKDFDRPSSIIEMKESTLMPVLLPPLSDPLRPTSALGKRPEMEDFPYPHSQIKDVTELSSSPALSPQTMFSPSLVSPNTDNPMSPILDSVSPTSPGFGFPFRSESNGLSRMVEYEEDFSNWKPSFRAANQGGEYVDNDLERQQSWPLQLEDLIRPNPPFASEDRFMYPSPSESRLSTITEESTIRESLATPQNIPPSDVSAKGMESSVAPAVNTRRLLANWFPRIETKNNVGREMNQFGKTPSEGT